MADARNLRVLTILADGEEIGADCRMRVLGRSTMTCLPDPWQIEIYNPPDHDLALLKKAATVTARGQRGSLLCEGPPADILVNWEAGQQIVTVLLMEGEAFWRATSSLTMRAGMTIGQTLRTLLAQCSSPLPLVTEAALTQQILSAQTFFGRTADYVDELARAADCRGWTLHDGLYISRKGDDVPRSTLVDNDLLREPSRMTGAVLVWTDVLGLMTGQMIRLETERLSGVYRLAAQTVDADNYTGDWSCTLTLMDEDEQGLTTQAWEGIV